MCISNRNLRHKEKGTEIKLNLKVVAMTNPVTGRFEIAQYDDKRVKYIADLVETTWLSRYPRPI